ncbi:exopolysaccharide biosynthesis polyprenyl glycosylphosphotransferase [Algoriphagus boritolerans]|uniref:Putative colanic acid biosysnthesis UDP-glucose lipid carrier transferase n=1 Tax=Algoriphagus boritolerans DSM 17298 = JCM 18970 TaxID=1120964 RepID=A0A1H5YNH9_9BACT|nr:exopolysaccharide biosynthesis polyprenyl glycosylphosphotransferase [Algoriphagus boritolerans]SEG25037.1 putative colanic acid biosysnthesis UDP-glucose lipid carrier transferase [Algoriphagus boritolerans DSM 17298 = JCM 18970]
MKRRFDTYFPWFFTFSDFLASLISLLVANLLLQLTGGFEGAGFSAFLPLSVFWLLISALRKDYKIGRTDEYDHTLRNLLVTLLWFLVATAILWRPLQSGNIRWIQLLVLGVTMVILMGSFRVFVHILLRRYRAKGNNYQNAVIVGKGGTSPRLADVFRIRKDFGINFLGYFDDQADCNQTRGGIKDFFGQAPALDLDLIYIQEHLDPALVKRVIDFADENYIKVKMIPGSSLQLEKNLSFSKYGDFFVINVNEIPLDHPLNSFAKRTFDLVFAGLVTIFILSWLIPLVGIFIKLESKGPVFFIQKRNGVNNKEFNCLKFRSMTPNDYADTKQATKNDPRVTRIGSFLRNSSLDEMPQFLNVLAGDMSIVGPRPHTIPMNQTFKTQIERYNSRHKIRPGITGLAQVRGFRGEIENTYQIRSRVRLDYFYINNWSFFLDMGIMIKTIHELLFNRENAY